jgi:tetratricopeptide (TPR) repeat protein
MAVEKGEAQTMLKNLRWIFLLAGVAAAPMAATAQQVPGPHPAYLHALSDLRAARHYLNDGWAWEAVRRDDNAAIGEIDAAIREIKRAAIDDGKGDADPFPIDRHLSPHDRFRKANELLAAAHADLAKAEDVPAARGLRDRAIGHVDEAHRIVDAAWRTAHWE